MKKELLKYIDEEKSISKYKITLLRKGPEKPYKTRLLSIESDFISYPFHKIKAKNINELKDALPSLSNASFSYVELVEPLTPYIKSHC